MSPKVKGYTDICHAHDIYGYGTIPVSHWRHINLFNLFKTTWRILLWLIQSLHLIWDYTDNNTAVIKDGDREHTSVELGTFTRPSSTVVNTARSAVDTLAEWTAGCVTVPADVSEWAVAQVRAGLIDASRVVVTLRRLHLTFIDVNFTAAALHISTTHHVY